MGHSQSWGVQVVCLGLCRDRGGEKLEGWREQKSGGVVMVTPCNDGQVWVAYKKGRLEKYTAYGKMLLRKVRARTPKHCLKAARARVEAFSPAEPCAQLCSHLLCDEVACMMSEFILASHSSPWLHQHTHSIVTI